MTKEEKIFQFSINLKKSINFLFNEFHDVKLKVIKRQLLRLIIQKNITGFNND